LKFVAKHFAKGRCASITRAPGGQMFFFFVPGGLARSIFRIYIRKLIYNCSINNDTHEYKT
jgi:hypothetical protein